MRFEQIVKDLSRLNVNLIDFAIHSENTGLIEHRFQDASNCSDSYSIAKAFVMTAVGMLWDEGKVDISSTVYSILRDCFPVKADPAWRLVTLDHVMTHRVGFDRGFMDIDVENVSDYASDDYLSIALSHPIVYVPGTHYQYSDAAYYVLSRIVAEVSGEMLDEFLRKRLIRALRFREIAWSRCPLGYPIGATGLYISSSDMVKLARLYLDSGVYEGERYLSENWVNLAIAREFEFHNLTGTDLIGKGGLYGQNLVFSQKANFAAAWHAFERDHEKNIRVVEYMNSIDRIEK